MNIEDFLIIIFLSIAGVIFALLMGLLFSLPYRRESIGPVPFIPSKKENK
jgi:hypothetical protein